MNTVAIIQARMSSSRLPGKVLKPILGRPMLELLLERVKHTRSLEKIVVATSINPENDAIEVLVNRLDGVDLFRGSEDDVLDRYFQAARHFHADVIVRITADNPFYDWQLTDEIVDGFINGGFDYSSSGLEPSFPYGIGAEVFSMESFQKVAAEAASPLEREHVTPYYYQHPELFRLGGVRNEKNLSHVRLTVDTPEDFQRAVELFAKHGPDVTFREIVDA